MLRTIFSLFHSEDVRAVCCATPDCASAHWGPGITGFIHPVLSLECVFTLYQWVYHLISFQVLWLADLAEGQTFPSHSCRVQSLNSLGIGTICVLQGYRSLGYKVKPEVMLDSHGNQDHNQAEKKISNEHLKSDASWELCAKGNKYHGGFAFK